MSDEQPLDDESGVVYATCQKVYKAMLERAQLRTATWLENNGFDIEFMPNYNYAVPVYHGSQESVANQIGRRGWISREISVLRTIGSIWRLKPGLYALIEEPNKTKFQELIIRKRQLMGSTKDPLRSEFRMQIAAMERKIRELDLRVQALELRGHEI